MAFCPGAALRSPSAAWSSGSIRAGQVVRTDLQPCCQKGLTWFGSKIWKNPCLGHCQNNGSLGGNKSGKADTMASLKLWFCLGQANDRPARSFRKVWGTCQPLWALIDSHIFLVIWELHRCKIYTHAYERPSRPQWSTDPWPNVRLQTYKKSKLWQVC